VLLWARARGSILGLVAAILPSIPFIRRRFPSEIMKFKQTMVSGSDDDTRVSDGSCCPGIALSLQSVRIRLCLKLPGIGQLQPFFITIITVILANIAPHRFAKPGDFAVGMLCMYAFLPLLARARSLPFLPRHRFCSFIAPTCWPQFVVLLLQKCSK
jgi:hypothetical protein